jgi:hypothetical protein
MIGAKRVSHLRRSGLSREFSQAFRPGLSCAAPTALVLWFFGNGVACYRRSRTCDSAVMRFAIVFFLLATSVCAQTTLQR